MKRLLFIICLLANSIINSTANPRHDHVVLTIGEHEFTAGEFWHIYNKNRHLPGFDETPREFASRFIDYKLKVVEARSQGLDTLPSFVNDLKRYTQELKASFLVDSAIIEQLARQAHHNMSHVLNASHILVRLQPGASAADTLEAWTRINHIREQVLAGVNFNDLAARYSEDPSAINNQGRLGYFSAFRMVYPFEKVAFVTPVGQVSGIARSEFGYHLVKVHEKLPNPGRVRVAHIMKTVPRGSAPGDEARLKAAIDSIHYLLKAGGDFSTLAKTYSDDQESAWQGGELSPFSMQDIVPEFALAAFALKNDGEFSAPVRTPFGWHIIKRLELIPVGSFEQARPMIMNMMSRDGRGRAGQEAFVQTRREGPNFYLNHEMVTLLVSGMTHQGEGNLKFIDNFRSKTGEILFRYHDQEVLLGQLLDAIEQTEYFNPLEGTPAITRVLDAMIEDVILRVEKQHLAKNVPRYRYLANEYHDGLLIFEISNREIWQRVGSDSVAIENFYLANQDKFAGTPVLNGTLCKVNSRRLAQRASRLINKAVDTANMVQILKENARNDGCFNCTEGSFPFLNGATNPVDAENLPGGNPFAETGKPVFWSGKVVKPAVPPLSEIRGKVMSAYQEKLHDEWVTLLREKHNPVFNYRAIRRGNPLDNNKQQ